MLSLLRAFKMGHSAAGAPISMWSALQWPVEFPPCPFAIVSSSQSCPRSSYFLTTVRTMSELSLSCPPIQTLRQCLSSIDQPCRPLFPISIISPLIDFDLCFVSSALSDCHLRQRRWTMSTCFICTQGWSRKVVDLAGKCGGQILQISCWPTFLLAHFSNKNPQEINSFMVCAKTSTLVKCPYGHMGVISALHEAAVMVLWWHTTHEKHQAS